MLVSALKIQKIKKPRPLKNRYLILIAFSLTPQRERIKAHQEFQLLPRAYINIIFLQLRSEDFCTLKSLMQYFIFVVSSHTCKIRESFPLRLFLLEAYNYRMLQIFFICSGIDQQNTGRDGTYEIFSYFIMENGSLIWFHTDYNIWKNI